MPKKPGRPPAKPAAKVGPQYVGKTPDADAKKEVALRQHQDEALAKYGVGVPYAREHSIARFRQAAARTVESIIECGRELLVMQAHEPRGEWLPLLRELGIESRYAQGMMAAAARIDSKRLAEPARKMLESSGGPSKLFDLLAMDDDELAKIAGHQTEIDPDEIEQMTRSELRHKLRQSREDLDAREKVLGRNAERIEQLKEQVVRIQREPVDEKSKGMLLETGSSAMTVAEDLKHLIKCVDTLVQHELSSGRDPLSARQGIEHQLHPVLDSIGELMEVLESYGITGFVAAIAAAVQRK